MGVGEPWVGVLGPLLIEVDGRPVPPPGSGVVRGLLGVLLLVGERPLTTERPGGSWPRARRKRRRRSPNAP